jgi:hypothetical protein
MAGDPHSIVDEIEEFLVERGVRGIPSGPWPPCFTTNIVGSTERAAALGDRRWPDLLTAHDVVVCHHLRVHGGTEIKTMGDGFLATFEGPARAIHCAREMLDRARGLGVAICAGIHTGEVELTDGDLAGMAVKIGARVGTSSGAWKPRSGWCATRGAAQPSATGRGARRGRRRAGGVREIERGPGVAGRPSPRACLHPRRYPCRRPAAV